MAADEEVVRDQLAEYYGLITHLDEQVGRIHRQLFDLQDDPDELRNLIAEPEYSETASRLDALLEGWRAAMVDAAPLSVPEPAPLRRDLTGTERKPDRWQPEWIVKKYFDVPAVGDG